MCPKLPFIPYCCVSIELAPETCEKTVSKPLHLDPIEAVLKIHWGSTDKTRGETRCW